MQIDGLVLAVLISTIAFYCVGLPVLLYVTTVALVIFILSDKELRYYDTD